MKRMWFGNLKIYLWICQDKLNPPEGRGEVKGELNPPEEDPWDKR